MRINFLFLLFIITGCYSPPIAVQTEYLTHQHLASSYVQTPDPRQQESYLGQRLIITWSLPSSCGDGSELIMNLKIRFRNREEQELFIPIKERNGTYIYDLMNQQFCQFGGILTYKIDIYSGNSVLAEWRHQLWAELITFEE